uniref:Plectin/eS10 N-terminal domain-containing protein n=1 Tax=Accipiter nisus TaxID=211598 RepID=A0A8B9RS87_9AVES
MLMPLERLRAILELLFREGVLVAEKDPRPRRAHPQLPGVPNVEVLRAMASLRSRRLVRETFAWRHFYWYLTDEGIAYLRQYLRLPPEIVPLSLQRTRRPAVPARRPAADTADPATGTGRARPAAGRLPRMPQGGWAAGGLAAAGPPPGSPRWVGGCAVGGGCTA